MGNVCQPPTATEKLEVEGGPSMPSANQGSRRRSGVSAEVPSLNGSGKKAQKFPKSDEDRAWLRKILTKIFLFQGIDDETLDEVIDVMRKEVVKKGGHTVIAQNELNAEYFYIIESGECDVYKFSDNDPKRESKFIVTITPEKYFGELALMYNAPRAATVKTKKACTFWKLDRETFQRVRIQVRAKQLADAEKFLKEVPFLKPMTKDSLSALADCLEPNVFDAGEVIVKQGERGERMYILEQGDAVATITKSDSSSENVKTYTRGDYFGELALLNDAPRAANVVAKTRCKVLSLDKQAFDRLMGDVKALLEKNAKAYPALYDKYVVSERRNSKK